MKFKTFFNKNFFYRILQYTGIKFLIYNSIYLIFFAFNKLDLKIFRSVIFKLNRKKDLIFFNSGKEKFILFTKDFEVSKSIYLHKSFDLHKFFKVMKLLKRKKINTLYNIGANIGSICIPTITRDLVKFAHVVEMEPNNFKLLKLNIGLNNLENKIKAYNFAMSNIDNKLVSIEYAKNNFGAHSVSRKNLKGPRVFSKKFDTLFKNIERKNSLIWVDTEGYEEKILGGSKKMLRNKCPIVIEFWPKALLKFNSYNKLKKHINSYEFLYDLSEEEPSKLRINKKNIDNFFLDWKKKTYRNPNKTIFTDLLLI